MRIKLFMSLIIGCSLLAFGASWAAAPIATPMDGLPEGDSGYQPQMEVMIEPEYGIESFPNGDLLGAIFAGADYLRTMQADYTEDNAGNGEIDDLDPDDSGWDWRTTIFEHSDTASSLNLYGATVQGLYRAYLLDPRDEWFVAMRDAADHIVTQGAANIHTASDIMFLLDFATLDGVAAPQTYIDAAVAIWDWRVTNSGGGTAAGIAEYIRDARAGQGYRNGIIAWDIGLYAEAAMALHGIDSLAGYDQAAKDIAEVLYQDSFELLPYGHFDVRGRCKGNDPEYANYDYYWYALGVGGLIEAFASSGEHTDLLPELQTLLLECQYPDGAMSYQYGASELFNDRTWQATGYSMMHMGDFLLPHTPEVLEAMRLGGEWLAANQDISGGFVYASSGNHYPEVGSECTAGMVSSWLAAGSHIVTNLSEAGPINCGDTMTATFAYDREEGTAGLRGYEITFTASAEVSFVAGDIHDEGGLGGGFFQVVDNLDGSFTVSDAILGETAGLLDDADLFRVVLHPVVDGEATVSILDYKLRDPDNADITADLAGAAFTVDCTAPDPVTDIAADPGDDQVTVTWTDPAADVATVEIWRGMWYGDPGVSAYPRYDDLTGNTVPTRPTVYDDLPPVDSGEWILAATVAAGAEQYVDEGMTQRGVYYYEVIAVDEASNHSAPAEANDRATSYWLGDIADPYDGTVGTADMSALGATFGLAVGDEFYDFEADVGPTDDWSGYGIPTTDALVDFEDLMIFAMNHGVVTPSAKSAPANTPLMLAWTAVDDLTWSLQLTEACPALKGLRLRAVLPAGVTGKAVGGEMLAQQKTPSFIRDIGEHGLDINLALFGTDVGFSGSGELVRVTLSEPVDLAGAEITARDVANGKMSFGLDADGGAVPQAFSLNQNVPNPFNPMTKIRFSLPEEQMVRMTVIALDGRRVATLVETAMAPGQHEVIWDGRDDSGRSLASGTYFYRIDAGPYSQTRKMTLVR